MRSRRNDPTGDDPEDPIVVGEATHREGSVSAPVTVRGRRTTVSFRVSGAPALPFDDPFVPVALLLGMRLGLPVRIDGPVSRPLLDSLALARADLLGLYPGLADVALDARRPVPGLPATGGGVACFFSGGLDSFHSLLEHRDEVTDVVFVHGFDVRLDAAALRARVAAAIRSAAGELGKRVVEVETDVRALSDPFASWSWFSHAGLAAVALLLSGSFREVLFAATLADEHRASPPPGGGRRTWDNGLARIRRDGGEATRVAKARRVAADPTARRWLRVCWANPGGAYNCGTCPKCVRTMVNLALAGGLAGFETLPHALDLGAVRRQPARRRSDRLFLEENLREAERLDPGSSLAAALRDALRPRRLRSVGDGLRALLRRGPRTGNASRRAR